MLRKMLSFLLCAALSCTVFTACSQSQADTAVSGVSSVTDSGTVSDAAAASGSSDISDAAAYCYTHCRKRSSAEELRPTNQWMALRSNGGRRCV